MKTYAGIFLFLFALRLSAQAPFFKSHPLGEEFLSVKVEKIYQDRQSLLWFGSTEGLFRYDGLEFQRFVKNDTTSQHVTAIYQQASGKLWIGYDDGSICWFEKEQLVPWQPEEGPPAKAITGIAEDAAGQFWFSTYGEGVYCLKNNRLYNLNQEDGLSSNDIYVLASDRRGRMWVGSDGGISIISAANTGREKSQIKNLTVADGLPDNIVRELLADARGNFWVGTYDKGFCFYNVEKQQFTQPVKNWSHGSVSHLALFDDRELWIGTEGEGVWLYSLTDQTLHPLGDEAGLDGSKIYDLLKDIEGNIWVISNTGGIQHANRQFGFVKAPFENVQAVLCDRQNNLWIGSQKGLFTQRPDERGNPFFRQHLAHIPLNVISLYEDKFGNIWIGTFGEGAYLFKPATGQLRRLTEKDGLANGSILSIAGAGNKVWLATLGGATQFLLEHDPLTRRSTEVKIRHYPTETPTPIPHLNFSQASGLGTDFIYKVFIDSKGRTWFGTDGKGISVLDENGKITNYSHALHRHPVAKKTTEELPGGRKNAAPNAENQQVVTEDIPLRAIYSITEDRRGHIWFSTAKEGIFEFDGKNFRHLTVKEGMRELTITSLITTEKGEILVVHASGIDLLTPETRHLIYYDRQVGIENLDPSLNAVCTDQHGNIWIGSKGNLIRYTPLRERLSIHPRTFLNSVSVFLEPIDFQKKSVFSHDENNLVFTYTGLWYTDPGTVQYRYKLENYDVYWITSKDRRATYSNLPPGKYVFKVTSTENAAYLDEPVVEYAFEVKAPIWMRWWFLLFMVLMTGGLLYLIIRERERTISRETTLKKEKIESQYEALKAQINPHFLFNSFNTLISIIEEDPHRAVTYVEHLSDFYRSILQYREKEIIKLDEEIKLVESYSHLLQHRYGNNLRLDIRAEDKGNDLYIAPLTLQMLVENAVKHNVISKTKPLVIAIHANGSDYLEVQNNLQPKLDSSKSTGFGLQSIVHRYEVLSDRKVKIEKTEEYFKVSIPVIKS